MGKCGKGTRKIPRKIPRAFSYILTQEYTQVSNQFLTCLSSRMFNFFISAGTLTESKMGLTAGPEYGGPGMLDGSVMRRGVPRVVAAGATKALAAYR